MFCVFSLLMGGVTSLEPVVNSLICTQNTSLTGSLSSDVLVNDSLVVERPISFRHTIRDGLFLLPLKDGDETGEGVY